MSPERHIEISRDIKIRLRVRVRDDASHSSGFMADKHIDIGLKERHRPAKQKNVKSCV